MNAEKEKEQSAENEQLPELSPCPFCGGNAVLKCYDELGGFIVICGEGEEVCDISPSAHLFNNKKDAIKAWNRRVRND